MPDFIADDTFVLGKGITEPGAGSDNRLPPDDPKAGLKLKAERKGDEWILNGEEAFIANAPVGKLFFIDARTDSSVPLKQGTTLFLVPRDTPGFRIGKVFNKSGWRFYQNGEMIFENARVPHANVVGEVNGATRKSGGQGGDTTGGDLASATSGARRQRARHLRRPPARARCATPGPRPRAASRCSRSRTSRNSPSTGCTCSPEALRSFVLRVAWEHDMKVHCSQRRPRDELLLRRGAGGGRKLYMEVRGLDGCHMDPHADKLVRDSIIWTHLAADSVRRG